MASWSSIDHYGRWKALHYASRRFFAPLLLSPEDDGPRIGVHLTNDPLTAWHGELHWSLQTLAGQVVDAGVDPILAPAASTLTVRRFDFGAHINDATRRRLVLVADLWAAGQRLATSLACFVPDKHLELEQPRLSTRVTVTAAEVQVTVTATSLARFLEVSLEGADLVWSDNYFDLPAGRSCTLTAALPPNWSAAQIEAGVRVRSLFNTFGGSTGG